MPELWISLSLLGLVAPPYPVHAPGVQDLDLPPLPARDVRPLVPCNILLPSQSGNHATNLWPNGRVPYVFDDNVDSGNRKRALEAMSVLQETACITFVERTTENDYLHIQDDVENRSFVGRIGGLQTLGIHNWSHRFVIVHQIMHAVGAWHEQQRPDRDNYVRIMWDRIPDNRRHNFQIPEGATAYDYYDFDSVMHDDECAHSCCDEENPCPPQGCHANSRACRTVEVLGRNKGWQDDIGQRDHLSTGDRNLLDHLYGLGGEQVIEAQCRTSGDDVKAVVVLARNAVPGRKYTAKLDSGQEVMARATSQGELRFKFRRNNTPECGPNGVTINCLYYPFACCLGGMAFIRGGEFAMGCHAETGESCQSQELPVHDVYVDPFLMDINLVTNRQYVEFLNSAYAQGLIEVRGGVVFKSGDVELYCDTFPSSRQSGILWNNRKFKVLPGVKEHPMLRVTWYGAAAYANWLSTEQGREPCYDVNSWACNFGSSGFRLPTEAEWEYAARGGMHRPYLAYPWGNEIDGSKANFRGSGDPYEAGEQPYSTPVGYYNGQQIPPGVDMANGYGLYDMSGNLWEWCNDWYSASYYERSPYDNPTGPLTGSQRTVRGGSWDSFVRFLRCAERGWYTPEFRDFSVVGFRLTARP